jgi:hypothetical protein
MCTFLVDLQLTDHLDVTVVPFVDIDIDITLTKKVTVIASIQVKIQKIVSIFSTACLKIYKIKKIELPSIYFKLVIDLSVKIFLEIVCCILNAAKVLKCCKSPYP